MLTHPPVRTPARPPARRPSDEGGVTHAHAARLQVSMRKFTAAAGMPPMPPTTSGGQGPPPAAPEPPTQGASGPENGGGGDGGGGLGTDPATSWPIVQDGLNSVQVFGKGEWGAFLASPTGKDWQLFVVSKKKGRPS